MESHIFVSMFKQFLPLAMRILQLPSLPEFKFRDEISADTQPSFGMYASGAHVLFVALSNRHPIDILRTIAHELVHYKQDLNDELHDDSGVTGSPHENQANQMAGVVMRNFNKQYPQYLKAKPMLSESRIHQQYNHEDYTKNKTPDSLLVTANTQDTITIDRMVARTNQIIASKDRDIARIKRKQSRDLMQQAQSAKEKP